MLFIFPVCKHLGKWLGAHQTPSTGLQHPSTTAVFSYAIGSRKLSANEPFFIGAQTVVSLLQTTQIISDICFITNHTAYASWNKTKIVWIETELFFCNWGGCVSCLHACLGTRLLPDLLEGADHVGRQLCRDKECPFSGVTKSGRVWRRVPKAMLGVWVHVSGLAAL